jgi:hypothetical protein
VSCGGLSLQSSTGSLSVKRKTGVARRLGLELQ